MRFDGSVSENLRGDFLPENGRLQRHFGFSILMLAQFSQRKKMRLELALLRKFTPRLYEYFFRNYSPLKQD